MSAIILINPGTGHPGPALLSRAWRAARQFRRDVQDPDYTVDRDLPDRIVGKIYLERRPERDERGRGYYGFVLLFGKRSVDLDVPGIDLKRMRYTGRGLDPFAHQRLYIDGNSWWWDHGISVVRSALRGNP